MKYRIITICLALISFASFAQTECSQYHRKGCSDRSGMLMKYDGQSKSAILGKGQNSEFHMVAYKDLDYRITVCSEEILGSEVHFKIYEETKVLVKKKQVAEQTGSEDDDDLGLDYDESIAPGQKEAPKYKIVKELLYDSSEDGYSPKIEFTAESAMSLIIEVIVPGEGGGMKLKIRETGCVGVLIEHTKSQKIGF